MKTFPNTLRPENKKYFIEYQRERCKCYLRKNLYEHMISNEEKDYFSLDNFFSQVGVSLGKEIVNELIEELKSLGWKCKTSFGGTGLFIYIDNPPSNCFEDII